MIVSDAFLLLLFLISGTAMYVLGVLYGKARPWTEDAIRAVRRELVTREYRDLARDTNILTAVVVLDDLSLTLDNERGDK